ncbi:MAG: DUF192 domain-containing protein [Alphaproteobacteria bacterium]|nr:DUF192 domain-containing protein [Alphaproteobacteria bacterium]
MPTLAKPLGALIVLFSIACTVPSIQSHAETTTIIFSAPPSATPIATITAEIARNGTTRARGLMFRSHLMPRHGMVFLFPRRDTVSFWMKDTYISLDLIFLDDMGRVTGIHRDATPLSTRAIPSPSPVVAVLEVAGGEAARLGITVGHHTNLAAVLRAFPPQ